MTKSRATVDDAAALLALVQAGGALGRVLDHATRRAASLTLSQHQVLAALLSADPAPMEPRQIGAVIGSGSAHVTVLLDQLERAGALERRAHDTDRRRRAIVLTEAGRERARASTEAVNAAARVVIARAGGLTGDDILQVAGPLDGAVGDVAGAVWLVGEGDPGRAPIPGGR